MRKDVLSGTRNLQGSYVKLGVVMENKPSFQVVSSHQKTLALYTLYINVNKICLYFLHWKKTSTATANPANDGESLYFLLKKLDRMKSNTRHHCQLINYTSAVMVGTEEWVKDTFLSEWILHELRLPNIIKKFTVK